MEERQKNIFHVFSLPKLKFLYSFGRKGKGPDEFSNIVMNSINVHDNQLILYNFATRRLIYYEVTDTSFVSQKRIPLSANYITILNDVRRISDSVYISMVPYFALRKYYNHEFLALKPGSKGNPLFTFGNLPIPDIKNAKEFFNYSKGTIVSPNGSKIATFYVYHDALKIFNSKGQLLIKEKINDPFINNDRSSKFIYRINMVATNNYIYTLGAYATEKELSSLDPKTFRPSLEIWNWNGQPVYRARLDQPVMGFAISEKYGKLYGISVFNKHKIYIYDLSTILNK